MVYQPSEAVAGHKHRLLNPYQHSQAIEKHKSDCRSSTSLHQPSRDVNSDYQNSISLQTLLSKTFPTFTSLWQRKSVLSNPFLVSTSFCGAEMDVKWGSTNTGWHINAHYVKLSIMKYMRMGHLFLRWMGGIYGLIRRANCNLHGWGIYGSNG